MKIRQAAGWSLLSLIPATFVGLAALAGQLPELAVGAGVAAVLCGAAVLGVHLIDSSKEQQ